MLSPPSARLAKDLSIPAASERSRGEITRSILDEGETEVGMCRGLVSWCIGNRGEVGVEDDGIAKAEVGEVGIEGVGVGEVRIGDAGAGAGDWDRGRGMDTGVLGEGVELGWIGWVLDIDAVSDTLWLGVGSSVEMLSRNPGLNGAARPLGSSRLSALWNDLNASLRWPVSGASRKSSFS